MRMNRRGENERITVTEIIYGGVLKYPIASINIPCNWIDLLTDISAEYNSSDNSYKMKGHLIILTMFLTKSL